MDCSMPGFPIHHQFLELAQTHVHQVGDAIQPSHLPSSPSPPAFSLSQHQGFSSESIPCIRWPKYWSLSISPSREYSGLISFRIEWFDLRKLCMRVCVCVWSVPSKSLMTELTQDCGNRLLEGTNKTCAHQDLGERSSDPTRDWPRPACECPGVYSGGVGWQWPAAASGALNTSSPLKKVTIIFITPIIVWSQVKQQGRNTTQFINRELDSGFTKHGPAHQNKTQFPPQSSLPSGSFHKPLILTCQRVRKTTDTEN